MDTTHQKVELLPRLVLHLRFLAPLMLLSWWLAWKFQDPFISDWDGFDYTVSIVRGLPSPLGLGRALFIGFYHEVWRLLRHFDLLRNEESYLILRYGSILLSGPAVAGIYALTHELTRNRLAALLAGLLLALSPYFIIYSGRSMSETPGLFILAWSLWALARSLHSRSQPRRRFFLIMISAILIGLAANVREIAIFYLPFIPLAILLAGERLWIAVASISLATLSSLSGMVYWILKRGYLYWDEVMIWYRLSAIERRHYPVTIRNFTLFSEYAYECSVATVILVPLAFALLWPRKERRTLLILGLIGLVANMTMLINHDLSVNPRYLLTGMVGLAPVCGWALADLYDHTPVRARLLLAGLLTITLASLIRIWPDYHWQSRNAVAAAAYLDRIRDLPWNSGFIVGARSPLINFYMGIEARPEWKTISPGSGWPDDRLGQAVDDLLLAGRFVYVDFDPEIWQYGERGSSREEKGLRMIRQRYCLRHIDKQLYLIDEPQVFTDAQDKIAGWEKP